MLSYTVISSESSLTFRMAVLVSSPLPIPNPIKMYCKKNMIIIQAPVYVYLNSRSIQKCENESFTKDQASTQNVIAYGILFSCTDELPLGTNLALPL